MLKFAASLISIDWISYCSAHNNAEHECRFPTAHYRYTCGFSYEYGNSWVQVTCAHKSAWIWVQLWVLRVLLVFSFTHPQFDLLYFDYYI